MATKIIRTSILVVLFLSVSQLVGFAAGNIIRVAIIRNASSITIDIRSAYKVYTLYTDELLYQSTKLRNSKVAPLNSGVKIGDDVFKIFAIKIIPERDATIRINNRIFRGEVDIIREKNMTLLVVNHVDVEDYVKGVLYHEISHKWQIEAIKTQAVVSRTFALYQAKINTSKDYDVTNDMYSQIYGGKTSEKYKTSQGVDMTKNEVLNFNNELFPAYFHATCAGYTEDVSMLWKEDWPPLKGVKCDFCKLSKHYKWQANLSLDEIEKTLKKNSHYIENIKDISFIDRDKSGRIIHLKIEGPIVAVVVSAKDFRQMFGPTIIRSTNFEVKIIDDAAIFNGFGWGHGVGLCQWGAYFMAEAGRKYDEILKCYYPGAKIKKVN